GMKLKERPGGPAEEALSPQALAAARRDTAQNAKIDRSRYEVVRSPERLQEWVTRAIEQGVVAVDTQTSSIDPMQATLTAGSLALARTEACYGPLGHRQGGEGDGAGDSLFGAGIESGQMSEADALDALKPLLEDAGVLKVGLDLKFDLQVFAGRGIALAPYDDVMLLSYVLDAGRSSHGIDVLSHRYLNHTTIDANQL